MSNLTSQFDKAYQLASELPTHLQLQLIGILQLEIERVGDAKMKAEDTPLTDDEIKQWTSGELMTGEEMVEAGLPGAWEQKGIEDPVQWLKAERERHWQERKAKWQRK